MDRQSLLAAFRIAIDNEEEAARFYTELAEKSDDSEMKKLFLRFAIDESSHSDSLKDLYRALRETVPPGK
jgi:rubrerythrin